MSEALSSRIEGSLADKLTRAVVIGLSGGLDSCVLLHALSCTPAVQARGLRALHVHHGLHADADRWADHCLALCDTLALPLAVVRVEVALDRSDGLEAAARDVRYAAFAAALGDDEVLALAHHGNDQAETFLLRALRASGTDGLAAMRAWRRLGRGWLWRPWLDVPRDELLAYARRHALAWIEDPGNADLDRDRNFLRHRVLPLLRERWPRTDAAFARSAALHAETSELLAAEDARALAEAGTGEHNVLSADCLLAMPSARRARILRGWIASLGFPALPATGIARIESDLLDSRPDASAQFRWSDVVIRRWRDLLHVGRRCAPLPSDFRLDWNGTASLQLPTGDRLGLAGAAMTGSAGARIATEAAAAFDFPVTVHAREGGERITLPGRAHSHALKQVLLDLGVPPWERERLPLLSDGDGMLLAAGDLVYAAPFDAWLRERGLRLEWTRF